MAKFARREYSSISVVRASSLLHPWVLMDTHLMWGKIFLFSVAFLLPRSPSKPRGKLTWNAVTVVPVKTRIQQVFLSTNPVALFRQAPQDCGWWSISRWVYVRAKFDPKFLSQPQMGILEEEEEDKWRQHFIFALENLDFFHRGKNIFQFLNWICHCTKLSLIWKRAFGKCV